MALFATDCLFSLSWLFVWCLSVLYSYGLRDVNVIEATIFYHPQPY